MEHSSLRCPKSSKPNGKVYALTQEEQGLFVKTLESHKVPKNRNDYKKQLLIELYTGMRMGEINALKPENVDFGRKVIHVRGTVSMGINNRIYRSDHPKTSAGVRDVPMNDLVRPILRDAIDEMVENPEGTIFYDHNQDRVISTM